MRLPDLAMAQVPRAIAGGPATFDQNSLWAGVQKPTRDHQPGRSNAHDTGVGCGTDPVGKMVGSVGK